MQLKCNSCGAVQSLNDSSKCTYCGNAIIVEDARKYLDLTNNSETGNLITMAESALEAGNTSEAINYYNKALEKGTSNSDAWLGKGISTVLSSTIGDIKTNEAITYWKNAIKFANDPSAMSKRVAVIINNTVIDFYPSIERHYIEFNDVKGAYTEFIDKFLILDYALSYAVTIDKDNIDLYENGYNLCQKVLNAREKSNDYKNKSFLDEETKKVLMNLDFVMIPKELFEIEKKYVSEINRLDPSRALIPFIVKKENIEKEKSDQDLQIKAEQEVHLKKGTKYASIGFVIGLIGGTIFSFLVGENSLLISIRDGIFFGVCFFVFVAAVFGNSNKKTVKNK